MSRRVAGIAATVLAVSSALVLLVRSAPTIVPPADIAVAELYTDLASHGRLLLGPYSRFGWHHPGPVYFYLQAPLYAASGRAGAEAVVSRAPAIGRAAARGAVFLTAVALILAVLDFREFVGFEHGEPGQRDVPPAVAAIEAYLDRQHARAAVIDVDAAWAQAVPIVLRLRQHHRRVSVSPGALFIFTDAFAPTGQEDAWVRVQPGSLRAPGGDWQQLFDAYWVSVYAR